MLIAVMFTPYYVNAKTEQEIFQEALNYVVYIRHEDQIPSLDYVEPVGFWDSVWDKIWGKEKAGKATGIVIGDGEDYYILTDGHVIRDGEEGEKYYVWFYGSENPVVVKKHGWDYLFDWGILTFEDKTYIPPGFATLGDSSSVTTGTSERFCSLGNPLAFRRYWRCGEIMKEREYLPGAQTFRIAVDMTCNPGDSGSPLIHMNKNGEVVGLTQSLSISRSPICFVSPINIFKKLSPLLKAGGEIKHGTLNMAILNTYDFTPGEIEKLGLEGAEKGVIVAGTLPGSAAEQAGVKVGSQIIALQNESGSVNIEIKNSAEFVENLHLNFSTGDTVVMMLKKGDIYEKIKIVMEAVDNMEETQIIIVPEKKE
ncbi:MAG: trypsin-like peptidase domain-containing protein [Candidatus Liptonbacteria bacterium]|nr:trypsin-like peptidase domain-containing protein [Candidatus Liptonbacteria bacterium]